MDSKHDYYSFLIAAKKLLRKSWWRQRWLYAAQVPRRCVPQLPRWTEENIIEAMWYTVRYYKPHRKTVIKPNQMQKANARNIPPWGFYCLSYTTSFVVCLQFYRTRIMPCVTGTFLHSRQSPTHPHTLTFT